MTELLSCPFCGGEAFVRIDITLNPMQSRYRVGCDKNSNCHGWYGHSRYYSTEAEAIAAWNSRAERTCKNVDEYANQGFFICGNCGFGKDGIEMITNYCPNCGRKVMSER